MPSPVSKFPHVDKAHAYVSDVLAGRIPACRWVKKACRRHLDDLKRAKTRTWPYTFDPAKAERVCRFGEMMPHVKGKWAKKDPITRKASRISLEPWQCFVISLDLRVGEEVERHAPVSKGVAVRAAQEREVDARRLASSAGGCSRRTTSQAPRFTRERRPKSRRGRCSGRRARWGLPNRNCRPASVRSVNARSIFRPAENAKFEPIIGKPGDGASPHLRDHRRVSRASGFDAVRHDENRNGRARAAARPRDLDGRREYLGALPRRLVRLRKDSRRHDRG
jgi:hypothetical protein